MSRRQSVLRLFPGLESTEALKYFTWLCSYTADTGPHPRGRIGSIDTLSVQGVVACHELPPDRTLGKKVVDATYIAQCLSDEIWEAHANPYCWPAILRFFTNFAPLGATATPGVVAMTQSPEVALFSE